MAGLFQGTNPNPFNTENLKDDEFWGSSTLWLVFFCFPFYLLANSKRGLLLQGKSGLYAVSRLSDSTPPSSICISESIPNTMSLNDEMLFSMAKRAINISFIKVWFDLVESKMQVKKNWPSLAVYLPSERSRIPSRNLSLFIPSHPNLFTIYPQKRRRCK